MSGITTYQSGRPMRVKFTGAVGNDTAMFSWFGNNAVAGGNALGATGIAPIVLRNGVTGNTSLGAAYVDAAAFVMPNFGSNGPAQAPFYMRSPTTNNWDVTFFKNFKISESKKFQFRLGFFNVFNSAFANSDLGDIAGQSGNTLSLNTLPNYDPQYAGSVCYQIPIGTPNGTGTVPAGSNPAQLRG